MAGRTAATRVLAAAGVAYSEHPYRYDGGGAIGAADALGLGPSEVVKTIVLVADGDPVLALATGDREVSTRAVGRSLGRRSVEPAPVPLAEKVTGYRVGGISPFGTRRSLPVLCDEAVAALPIAFVNGGRRGLLVGVDPVAFVEVLDADVAAITR